ncbi:hypothetical protein HMPREF9120_01911 [Neisseria sp. oral taxon 020 str. F0370]|nr:hypothetical protein HMPREF9120_01911 [Neisseria sp. oral taxon 020 str. F0370]
MGRPFPVFQTAFVRGGMNRVRRALRGLRPSETARRSVYSVVAAVQTAFRRGGARKWHETCVAGRFKAV